MSACCSEHNCRRRQPIRFYLGDLSGQVFAVTRADSYGVSETGRVIMRAVERHDVTAALRAFLAREREWVLEVLEDKP